MTGAMELVRTCFGPLGSRRARWGCVLLPRVPFVMLGVIGSTRYVPGCHVRAVTDVHVYSFHVSPLRRDVQWCEFAVEAPRVHISWVFNRNGSMILGQLHIMV